TLTPILGDVVNFSAPLWRLEERRARKPASANIFGGVALWQLQKLFQAAGDQDAEQRAQLVWGQGGEAELAQALIGLRARGRRRGLKTHLSLPHSQGSIDTPDELRRAGPGLRRGSDSRPERYLHHIIH
uniref:Arginine vasopressin-induced protein 1 n=1 Tax=Gadus morhua TaxID=8049 RepID=A0A8C4Z443_GADMO